MFSRYFSVNRSHSNSIRRRSVICDRQMKLKNNNICDLCSSSVLRPQSRNLSGVPGGLESSSHPGRSQTVYSCCNNYGSPSRRAFFQLDISVFDEFSRCSIYKPI
ncbi:hypothetical protein CDL12_29954 [Handroanthus impetiginosus]|uniref:Uncharacterized protein n=1 Tax=Handroanthus impetiginosus TaxID=429701 RepID=A0A2G9FWY9_9LAMI|nr:hypothetical protein CDL12_29954 [Handroanthus impetiginosus]